MTSHERRPQNIKSGISQQPLVGSYSNFKLKLWGPNHILKSSKWRWPPTEDNLKLLKVEYLSNHCIDRDLWVLRGKLEENPEEILSVALLSPACLYFFLGAHAKIWNPTTTPSVVLNSGGPKKTRTTRWAEQSHTQDFLWVFL